MWVYDAIKRHLKSRREKEVVIDWPAYSSALLTLLDRIEVTTDDDDTHDLCVQRFQIATDAGFTIEFGAPASGRMQ